MNQTDRKAHWENVYQTKPITEVGWYQPIPATSISFIEPLNLSLDAHIIDIGGGDSFLVDYLLSKGYSSVSVLDISAKAIERAQERLGAESPKIKWIVDDASKFLPQEKYQVWHDRAAFHFLTEDKDVQHYLSALNQSLLLGGYFVIGTFSTSGPKKCSGLDIRQYEADDLARLLGHDYKKINCIAPEHITPGGQIQHYTFCCFQRVRG